MKNKQFNHTVLLLEHFIQNLLLCMIAYYMLIIIQYFYNEQLKLHVKIITNECLTL